MKYKFSLDMKFFLLTSYRTKKLKNQDRRGTGSVDYHFRSSFFITLSCLEKPTIGGLFNYNLLKNKIIFLKYYFLFSSKSSEMELIQYLNPVFSLGPSSKT